jgi:hypothetical protein
MLKHNNGILVILIAFALLFFTPGAAYADEGTGGMELKVNGYLIRLIFPTPAKVGENEFHVQIAGPDGAPLRDATVKITAAPIVKTDSHESDMEKKPTVMAGHYVLNDMKEVQPTAASSGGMSGMGSQKTVAPISDKIDSHDAQKTEVRAVEPVSITLQAGHEAGEYGGAISFSQSGHWMLVVDFIAKGEMLKAEFPLEVATNIPGSYGILAGFFGLNTLIIGAAAVIRRKPKLV